MRTSVLTTSAPVTVFLHAQMGPKHKDKVGKNNKMCESNLESRS